MEEKKYLKWYNKIGYGSGDIAGNVVYAFLTSFMMVYLTDSVGLAAGVVGTLIAVSKLFDGFTDIFFGSMIDKTHSKMGKAKPWMLYGYIGCAITLVCCFAVPVSWGTTAKYAWFFISYTLLNGVFYTAIRNCVTVLQNDPVLKKAIKRNELSGRMDIVKEVPWERRNNSPTVTDTDEYNLKMYLEEHYEITSESVIKAGIDIVSNENKYHPIRDYLESLVWDGIPRIENMLPHFLGAEKSKYTIGVMKMHMLAAISRIYEPGIKYDIMLCLVGSQGAGKSTFFKYLAIKEEWFSDNLDHLDDENIYRKLQNHWIIEMGEMKATITAKNIEQIKSFLSRQKETYKVPYEVHPEDRPRQCVFCGTSNDLNFLPLDRTGNRRFAPVMTDMSKAEVHILDNEAESKAYIEQAWAEAMVLYRQGNVFLGFTKEIEEEAKRLQKEFMPEDTNAGIIQAFLDDYDDEYVCTRILFDEALHRTGEMKQWEGKEIANIMNNAIEGWKPHGTHRFGKEYGIQRSWKRMEDSVKKDKDGFMEVPEQLEIPFE